MNLLEMVEGAKESLSSPEEQRNDLLIPGPLLDINMYT